MFLPYSGALKSDNSITIRGVSEGEKARTSRKRELEMKKYCIAELNRQNQIKEKENFSKRLKLHKEHTERLRKIKIEVQNQKRQKATEKVRKRDQEIDKKLTKGYKDRMKELLTHKTTQPDGRKKWIQDQILKKEREQESKLKEEAEMNE